MLWRNYASQHPAKVSLRLGAFNFQQSITIARSNKGIRRRASIFHGRMHEEAASINGDWLSMFWGACKFLGLHVYLVSAARQKFVVDAPLHLWGDEMAGAASDQP